MILEDYIAIDLEMTGLNARRDSILEIGAVRVRNKRTEAEYQTIVCPHMSLQPEVIKLTGITNAMAAAGRELDEVVPEIVEFCSNLVLLGHNIIFDYSFLKQAASNRNIPFAYQGVDTLKIARKVLAQEQKKTLTALCALYGIRCGHSHRALDDARAAMELYEILEAEYEAVQPAVFVPYPLVFKAKRQQPASGRQKKHLQALAAYHSITLNIPWETLTKNEASRQIDRIISRYGRMPKQD